MPLGGAKRTIINTVLVFSFVALWHDLTFRLLTWGRLISLFIVPELLARWLVSPAKVCCGAYFAFFRRRFSLISRFRQWLVNLSISAWVMRTRHLLRRCVETLFSMP